MSLRLSTDYGQTQIKVYAFRQRAALFGSNAPDWRLLGKESRLRYQGLASTATDNNVDPEWPGFGITIASAPLPESPSTGLGLYGEYFDNRDLTNLVGARLDATIDFNWVANGPASDTTNPVIGVGPDTFC